MKFFPGRTEDKAPSPLPPTHLPLRKPCLAPQMVTGTSVEYGAHTQASHREFQRPSFQLPGAFSHVPFSAPWDPMLSGSKTQRWQTMSRSLLQVPMAALFVFRRVQSVGPKGAAMLLPAWCCAPHKSPKRFPSERKLPLKLTQVEGTNAQGSHYVSPDLHWYSYPPGRAFRVGVCRHGCKEAMAHFSGTAPSSFFFPCHASPVPILTKPPRETASCSQHQSPQRDACLAV